MSKQETNKKTNPLLEALKRKEEVQAERNKVGNMGKDLSSRFTQRPGAQKPTKRGGRNGQGKP